jgi:hypothetical protein
MSVSLIIVADRGTLKAFRVTKDEIMGTERLEPIEQSGSLEGSARISDRVSDQAGRFPVGNATAGGQMSHGENHNFELEMQARSVRQLAEDIGRLVTEENPDRWFLAADNELDQKVVDALDGSVRDKLKKRVRRNLTKVGKSELLAHFAGARF